MSTSALFTAALIGTAQAYTVISAPGPFMLKNIDPIVYPGQYDKSHLHSFFGSDAVTVGTNTSAELQKGCTNLENPNDLSVYWIPTPLYTKDGGKTYDPIPVMRFSAYYNLGEAPAEVAIPQDLKMVAGDALATTREQVLADSKAEWFCEGGGGGALDADGFPSETCSTHLQQLLYFPSCVNTDTLETAYKARSHGTANWCPPGMKSMPQLRFSIRYDLRKVLPGGWTGGSPFKLACGPAWCSHGDFVNGWTVEAAQNMVSTTQSKRDFSPVNGALGGFKDFANCKATDADPTRGTSNYAESVAAMSSAPAPADAAADADGDCKRAVDAAGWTSKSRFARS